ncbi:MAG: hypothetical protein IID41_04920 [Planctomycetes bacterium]|nr:hypothetical protein [Planctomycetota bacterium]
MSSAPTHTADRAPTDQVENIKDTIESLVIAFILAFVFRGFLVEAFVIPTGSMAPTLFGKHGTELCTECGWEYAYGLPDRHRERDKIKCPNCDWETASHELLPYHVSRSRCNKGKQWFNRNLKPKNPEVAELISHLSFQPKSGDRILVFKWPFDLGGPLLEAQRWDVVVFKNPLNGEDNYIKRLVGLPNEVLEIIDGDVYTCRVDELDAETRDLLDELVEAKYQVFQEGNGGSSARLRDVQKKLTIALNSKYRIQRKTSIAQEALWRVVFHQDYLPREAQRKRLPPRWEATGLPAGGSRWNTSQPRIRFDGLGGDRQTIEFRGKSIVDFYAYNYGSRMGEPSEPVGDLRLKLVLDYAEGAGVLGLRLAKSDDVFAVEFDPNGEVVLERQGERVPHAQRLRKIAHMLPWKVGEPIEIEFGIVDYRVYVKINGATESLIETTDEDYAPQIEQLRRRNHRQRHPPRAQIYADDLNLTLAHVVLERDVHYKNGTPGSNKGHLPWGTTGSPIYLRDGEHFMLGDNSPASQDSRLWVKPGDYLRERGRDYQIGTVPADQLIGKAFFVYWPSGRRIHWLPLLKDYGMIPSVGKMRWIR